MCWIWEQSSSASFSVERIPICVLDVRAELQCVIQRWANYSDLCAGCESRAPMRHPALSELFRFVCCIWEQSLQCVIQRWANYSDLYAASQSRASNASFSVERIIPIFVLDLRAEPPMRHSALSELFRFVCWIWEQSSSASFSVERIIPMFVLDLRAEPPMRHSALSELFRFVCSIWEQSLQCVIQRWANYSDLCAGSESRASVTMPSVANRIVCKTRMTSQRRWTKHCCTVLPTLLS
jgi:hypothetical protein